MIQAVSRFFPPFLTGEEYETQREQVFEELKKNQHRYGLTARELSEHCDMMHSDVKARLAGLSNDHKIVKLGKDTCSVADHDRDVWHYYAPEHMELGGTSE